MKPKGHLRCGVTTAGWCNQGGIESSEREGRRTQGCYRDEVSLLGIGDDLGKKLLAAASQQMTRSHRHQELLCPCGHTVDTSLAGAILSGLAIGGNGLKGGYWRIGRGGF